MFALTFIFVAAVLLPASLLWWLARAKDLFARVAAALVGGQLLVLEVRQVDAARQARVEGPVVHRVRGVADFRLPHRQDAARRPLRRFQESGGDSHLQGNWSLPDITRPVMAGQRVSFILTRIFVQDTAAKIAANRQGQENGVVGE